MNDIALKATDLGAVCDRAVPATVPAAVSETTAIIQVIERAAANPNVDIDKMERLLEMQERILARNASVAFSAALAAMQAEMPVITERGEITVNNQVRSKYARFEDINDAVKPILQRHGFAMSFRTDFSDSFITVTGVLSHRDGHREETSIRLPADNSGSKNSVQAIGSSVSYGKRYTMQALLNITSRGEDDDGAKGGRAPTITEQQAADITALMQEVGADKDKFLRYMKVNAVNDIPASRYTDAVAALEKKRKA